MERNQSIWQLESDATNASSGSTADSIEKGNGTICGDEEAGTTAPPSKLQECAREYFPSINCAAPRSHTIDDWISVIELLLD
jgi:hypothetical protein